MDNSLKELKKNAKVSMDTQEKPDGHVYAFVNGKKEFFPLERVYLKDYKIKMSDLINKVFEQEKRIEKLKEINLEMLEKINKLEKELKLWIG
jgi:myo-inositol catabolism protein IolC